MEHIAMELSGPVAKITINRPEVMNALDPLAKLELSQAFDEVENNNEIWLAVLTGAGERAFSAGRDLKHTAAMAEASEEMRREQADMERRANTIITRFYFPKPVIARVNGLALGGGLELALACDIIVVADHAELGLPEPRRGLVAGGGGVHRLVRQIGLKQAMGYMLTGRNISAQRAYELGLVNQVVPLAELDAAIDEWVQDILRCAPLSVRSTKECAMKGLDEPLPEAFFDEYEWEKKRRESEDAREGPRAFAEKREPHWQGR